MSRVDNIARNMGEGEHYDLCIHKDEDGKCGIVEDNDYHRYDALSYFNTGNYGISTSGYCISIENCAHFEEK